MVTMDEADPLAARPPRSRDRGRTAARIGAGLLALAATAVWFRGPLSSVWPLVWPPTDGMAVTMALVVALSLFLPTAVAAGAVDVLYDRVLGD